MCKNSGFRSRIQKSYKKFGIESKNLIIFSESIPNLLPLCPLWLTQIAQISQAFFVGGKSHGCSPPVCSKGSHGFNEIQQDDYLWEFVVVCGWKKSLQQNVRLIRGICGFKGKPQISTNFHELFVG